jgi:hypothetical protein
MEYKHYIKVADDLIITETFTVHDFKQTKYYTNQDFSMFFWIDDWFNIDGQTIGVGLYFKSELVNQVLMYIKYELIKEEKDKIPLYDSFICNHPEYSNAVAIYDERSAESLVVIDMQN